MYSSSYATGNAVGGFFVIIVALFYLLILGLSIANYIITSLSIHKIASRRQISNSWLAWLPYGNSWILGSIVDYSDRRKGINRKWRVALLSLDIVTIVSFIFVYAILFIFAFSLTSSGTSIDANSSAIIVFIYLLLILILSIAATASICKTICMYKVFEVTLPEKALKYMLLSLFIPFANAFCLLKCKESTYELPTTDETVN